MTFRERFIRWLLEETGAVSTQVKVGGTFVATAAIVAAIIAGGGGGDGTTMCFSDPSSCGYPDASNTGPSGTLNTVPGATLPSGVTWDGPSEVLRVETDNVIVQNLDVPGGLTIDGDNVTVRNSRFHIESGCSTDSACGSFGVRIGQSGTPQIGTVLEDLDIVVGEDNTANDDPLDPTTIDTKVEHGIRNNSDQTLEADGLYVKGFGGAWKGPGTISNSYLSAQLVITGDHVENYLNGGEGSPNHLIHNTMFNPVAQTAVISFFDDFGPIEDVQIEDNFLAGGGYVIYGGDKNTGNVPGPVLVKDNRFARTASGAYYENGGAVNLFADFVDAVTQSCGNFWDDDESPITGPGSSC